MTFQLTFSHIVDGQRIPLVIDGQEVSKTVEAESKSTAIEHPDIVQFCEEHGNDTRVRRVQ